MKEENNHEDRNHEKMLTSLQSSCEKTGKKLSNENLVAYLLEDIKACKKHIKYEEFSSVQQKILKPIL